MGKPLIPLAPEFAKGERLTADKLNTMSRAINALAAQIDRSGPGKVSRNPSANPFQMHVYTNESGNPRLAISPGLVLGVDGQELDRNLSVRPLLTYWNGLSTGNTSFQISREFWNEPNDAILYQIENGGGADFSAESNGYYLCAEYDFATTGCDFTESYIGASTPYLGLEVPSSFIWMRLIPVDDWTADDDLNTDGTGTRRIGPLGFAQLTSNVATVVNYWNSDIMLPLVYRSAELTPIVSTDANNDITTGSDGGAFYNAP